MIGLKAAKLFTVGILASIILCGCPAKPSKENSVKAPANASSNPLRNVSFKDMDGNDVTIKDPPEGSAIYVVFFASWCKVCATEVPIVNDLYERYSDKGLLIYSVNVGDSVETVKKLIDKLGIVYPVFLDPDGTITSEKMKLVGLPLNLVIDSTGREVYRDAKPPSEDLLKKAMEAK